MLFWTKLLTVAHSITASVHPFLPLYYMHMLNFDIFTISLLTACTLLLRLPAYAFWIHLVDQRSPLHGVFTGLLTAVGAAGILLILSVPPSWTRLTLPVAIISSVLDGIFYQPLMILIDSAIIKILGDYKILYVNERKYGKHMAGFMSLCIGWFLDEDHDFDTLMVTTLIGSVVLFLLSLSTNVQAVDHELLGITPSQEEANEIISYTKNDTLFRKPDTKSTHNEPGYKPYSLFGDQLSHISEEDASLLQRIPTTSSALMKPQKYAPSIYSSCNSHNAATSPNNYAEESNVPYSYQHHATMLFNPHLPRNYLTESLTPSFELARLPYPPPEAPAVVLIKLFPSFCQPQNDSLHQNKLNQKLSLQQEEGYYYLQCSLETHQHYQQRSNWIVKSFISTALCLGMVYGMTQTLVFLYLHEILGLPMHMIGFIGSVMVAADLLANKLVIKIIQRFPLSITIAFAHILLVLCTLSYTWLSSDTIALNLFVIIIQCLQGLSFNLVWLLAAHQVDTVVLTDHKRVMLKGAMSAVYSCLGPALGVVFVGYFANACDGSGYIIIYRYAAGLVAMSTILSWEWSHTDV